MRKIYFAPLLLVMMINLCQADGLTGNPYYDGRANNIAIPDRMERPAYYTPARRHDEREEELLEKANEIAEERLKEERENDAER